MSPFAWIGSWTFILAVAIFFIAWIFQWAVVNAGNTVNSWGLNFGVGLIIEVCVQQPALIMLYFVITANATRSQLSAIHRTLVRVSMEFVDKSHVWISPLRIVQHLSPACRAARSPEAFMLPASFVLRNMDDIDQLNCQHGANDLIFGKSVLTLLLCVPLAVAALGSGGQGALLEQVVRGVFVCICLFNNSLLHASVAAIVVVNVFFFALFVYSYYWLQPATLRARRLIQTSKDGDMHSRFVCGRRSRSWLEYQQESLLR